MDFTASEVVQFIRENDVKFIRLAFCDLLGMQKNLSIMPDELPRAFAEGISFDAHAIRGFEQSGVDLFLKPDPGTLNVLPWRPSQGRVVRFFCNIFASDGTPFALDGRRLLAQAARQYAQAGYAVNVGTECEFYLFQTDENGAPTRIPFDNGSFFDISPQDKGENVRREICLYLEEMGLNPESSHHEKGPGQNEIIFRFSDPLAAADHFVTFKSVVKVVAARNGLHASFLPKPLPDQSGSALHINLSLSRQGQNLYDVASPAAYAQGQHFAAGVLSRARELSAFLHPLPNSFDRLPGVRAYHNLTCLPEDRNAFLRIPAASGDRQRIELRSPDPTINPYLAFALVLAAGWEGLQGQLALPEELPPQPGNLREALCAAAQSAFVTGVLGEHCLGRYIAWKQQEMTYAADAQASFLRE